MIPLLVIAGLYLLLWFPLLGHFLQDGIMHGVGHLLEHEWLLTAFRIFLPLIPLVMIAAAIAQWWYLAGDAALVLMILAKLFGTFSRH